MIIFFAYRITKERLSILSLFLVSFTIDFKAVIQVRNWSDGSLKKKLNYEMFFRSSWSPMELTIGRQPPGQGKSKIRKNIYFSSNDKCYRWNCKSFVLTEEGARDVDAK